MKTVSKILYILTSVFILAACNSNKEVDIEYEFKAKMDLIDIVKDLKNIKNADLFPNGKIEDSQYSVRTHFLIYDSKGALINEDIYFLTDFAQTVNITKVLPGGDFTVVAVADIVKVTGKRVDFEFWSFDSKNVLRDFKIKDLKYIGFENKVLGVYKSEVNLNRSKEISINIPPAGSLLTLYFKNITNTIAYIYYTWDKFSDYYWVNEGKSNILNSTFYQTYETNSQYSGMYDQRYYLPVQNFKFTWVTYDSEIEPIKTGSTTLNIFQGQNQTINIDVSNGNTQVSKVVGGHGYSEMMDNDLYKTFSTNHKQTEQTIEVGKMPYWEK